MKSVKQIRTKFLRLEAAKRKVEAEFASLKGLEMFTGRGKVLVARFEKIETQMAAYYDVIEDKPKKRKIKEKVKTPINKKRNGRKSKVE